MDVVMHVVRWKCLAALTEVFEGSMDADVCPDDNDIMYVLVAGVIDVEGLDLLMIKEAWVQDDCVKWDKVILRELKSLEDARMWNVIECPDNINIIVCKWVFKIKCTVSGEINKYKA